jgi:hypothetical protein
VPRVLNKHNTGSKPSDNCVLVDRTTKWGNPYRIGEDGTREEVIAAYEGWITRLIEELPDLYDIETLRGKDLVCWCAPEPCHADVLLRLANE